MNNSELKRQVLKWTHLAEEDFRLAEHAFTMKSNIPYRLIGYHAQQCAEKYLKGYLVSKLIDFPYSHSIEVLIKLCPPESGLHSLIEESAELTNYAIARRYPGDYGKIAKKDAIIAVESASNIRDRVRTLLLQENIL